MWWAFIIILMYFWMLSVVLFDACIAHFTHTHAATAVDGIKEQFTVSGNWQLSKANCIIA